ncbi:MAG: hypothetical protein IJB96_01690 [Lachnospira sp.]|nr:hypothetical protein [Lachnospira sp.]
MSKIAKRFNSGESKILLINVLNYYIKKAVRQRYIFMIYGRWTAFLKVLVTGG